MGLPIGPWALEPFWGTSPWPSPHGPRTTPIGRWGTTMFIYSTKNERNAHTESTKPRGESPRHKKKKVCKVLQGASAHAGRRQGARHRAQTRSRRSSASAQAQAAGATKFICATCGPYVAMWMWGNVQLGNGAVCGCGCPCPPKKIAKTRPRPTLGPRETINTKTAQGVRPLHKPHPKMAVLVLKDRAAPAHRHEEEEPPVD